MRTERPQDFDPTRWKDLRWSRWSFRATTDFLPTAPIAPSETPRPLPMGQPRRIEGWEAFLADTHATSALVVSGGQVVVEWPIGAATDPGPHMLFSITKSVVGLVARLLIDNETIDPDREATVYLPDLAGSAFAEATLDELLAMRDGVAFDETYADPAAEIHRYSKAYWGDAPGGVRARLAGLESRSRETRFAYRTPVADVVGALLTASTGCSLAQLVGDLLWRPMGAAHAAHFVCDTAGVEIAGAGLNATTSDLARLALLLLGRGSWSGRQVLPERIVAALFTGGDRSLFALGYPERSGWSYRDLWWNMGNGVAAALGVHGQRLIIDLPRDLALIRTGAQPEPDNRPYDPIHADMIKRIQVLPRSARL